MIFLRFLSVRSVNVIVVQSQPVNFFIFPLRFLRHILIRSICSEPSKEKIQVTESFTRPFRFSFILFIYIFFKLAYLCPEDLTLYIYYILSNIPNGFRGVINRVSVTWLTSSPHVCPFAQCMCSDKIYIIPKENRTKAEKRAKIYFIITTTINRMVSSTRFPLTLGRRCRLNNVN